MSYTDPTGFFFKKLFKASFIFLSVASAPSSPLGQALVHGVVNGAISAARGGNFLAGFATGVIGKVTGFASDILSQGNKLIDTAIVAASGCAGALIAKGSCANGAITAAFANMYNKWSRIANKGIDLGRRYVPEFKGAQKNLNHFFQNVLRDPARYLFGSNKGNELLGNILPFGAQIGKHTLSRMATRGVNTRMVDLALRKGQTYWDPANKTIQFILRPTSGKNVSVALNPVTRQITTVMRQSKSLVRPRFEALPRSRLDGMLK